MPDIKHFTATTYLIHKSKPHTLMLWHEKLQTWLPPGGHLEENETPEEAARREVEEETSIDDLQFIPLTDKSTGAIDTRASYLLMPHYLLEELIEPHHYHLDWIYFAYVNQEIQTHETLKWFSIEDLKKETLIFENVRILAIEAIDMGNKGI